MSHVFRFLQYQLRQFQMTSKSNLGLYSNNLYTLATSINGGQNEKYTRLVDSFVLTKVLSVYHFFFIFLFLFSFVITITIVLVTIFSNIILLSDEKNFIEETT